MEIRPECFRKKRDLHGKSIGKRRREEGLFAGGQSPRWYGVREEHDMQLYFRRAKTSEAVYGDGDFHRETVAGELGL